MRKDQFIKHLSQQHRRPQHHYRTAITEIFAGIQEQLKTGKPVTFIGFGTFSTRMRQPSTIIDFRTKQKRAVPQMRLAQFRAGSLLKQAVRGKAPAGKVKKPFAHTQGKTQPKKTASTVRKVKV